MGTAPHPDVRLSGPAERAPTTRRQSVVAVAARIARGQSGVVGCRQLVAAGASRSSIGRAVADGRLVRVHRGVYAVGHTALRPEGFWMAAVLTGGAGAVLSHRSACAALDLCRDPAMRVDITVVGDRWHRRAGVRVHRCRLDPRDVTVHHGIPITTPMRALLDLAEVADLRQVSRAMERSDRLGLYDGRAMGDLLGRSFGRRGVKPMRIVLERYDDNHRFTRSDLEDLALELVRDHGLPRPAVNARVGAYEVDLLWSDHQVVVEADGWAFHGTRAAFERDRRRDADLQAQGYRVLRVTWRQARNQAAWIADRLREVLARASREPRKLVDHRRDPDSRRA